MFQIYGSNPSRNLVSVNKCKERTEVECRVTQSLHCCIVCHLTWHHNVDNPSSYSRLSPPCCNISIEPDRLFAPNMILSWLSAGCCSPEGRRLLVVSGGSDCSTSSQSPCWGVSSNRGKCWLLLISWHTTDTPVYYLSETLTRFRPVGSKLEILFPTVWSDVWV